MTEDPGSEGPVVHKRILVGGPPSDLPDKPLVYPGKPLAHRFLPTEQVRRVEQAKFSEQPRLATATPFKPVAQVAYPDKNIYLAPVSNVRSRNIQPTALRGTVTLPVSSAGVFEISEELRRPLEARLDSARQARLERLSAPPEKEAPPSPETKNFVPAKLAQEAAPSPIESTRTELERLKELAIKELSARQSLEPPKPLPAKEAPSPTLSEPGSKFAFPIKEAAPEINLAVRSEGAVEVGTDAETRRLLSEAERLEAELANLHQGILPKGEVAEAPAKAVDEHLAQINQLVSDKTQLLKKVNELTTAYNEEVTKWRASETRLETLTRDFDRQLQEIRIEKTNLTDQLKTIQGESGDWQQKQSQFEKQTEELANLRSQLAVVGGERDDAKEHLKKLEALITDLRQGPAVEKEPETVVRPQVVEPERPQSPTAKIIKPQAAIGRMAPSLTSAPNVINGIVKDAAGLLLSNIIIVVKDEKSEPVRALKTNKIGQFAISTPLPNGTYIMELETPGHSFDIIEVEVKGKVLPPIEIRANN
jgi:hypothetical protein